MYENLGLTFFIHNGSKFTREDRNYLRNSFKDSTTRSLVLPGAQISFLNDDSIDDEIKTDQFREVAYCLRLCTQFIVMEIDPKLLDMKVNSYGVMDPYAC